MKSARESVTISWPAPSLPGICARTGAPTRSGVVLTPRGATYHGAELILPFSQAATVRQRALRRLALLAAVAAVGCGIGAAFSWFFVLPAVVALALVVYAGRNAHSISVFPVIRGRELLIPDIHPAFAEAVTNMPERCGKTADGGCATCTSSCLPQVQTT